MEVNFLPIISQFYGILIQMFCEINEKHNEKHIHIRYNEYKAVYNLQGKLLEGKLPIKKQKLVEAWIVIHKMELEKLWDNIKNGGEFYKIPPLK